MKNRVKILKSIEKNLYFYSINKIVKKLAKPGDIHTWGDGTKHKKLEDGTWEKVSDKEESSQVKERGTRGHLETKYSRPQTMVEDFKKNGKDITIQRALEITDSIQDYTGDKYSGIRSGKYPEKVKDIEEFIANAPVYKGKVYRGIVLKDATIPKVGEIINQKGISSWTDDEKSAQSFAKGDNKSRVIFVTDSTKSVSVTHLSQYGEEEGEVLYSGKQNFKVSSIENKKITIPARGTLNPAHKVTYTYVHIKEA